jgi:hypothetical protein
MNALQLGGENRAAANQPSIGKNKLEPIDQASGLPHKI